MKCACDYGMVYPGDHTRVVFNPTVTQCLIHSHLMKRRCDNVCLITLYMTPYTLCMSLFPLLSLSFYSLSGSVSVQLEIPYLKWLHTT